MVILKRLNFSVTCVFLLFIFLSINAGDFKHQFHVSVDNSYDQGYADNLGNIYIISGKNLTKYNNKGSKIATYTNQYQGPITSLDVSDPFHLLLFYRDYNQVVFLDNYLAELRSPVNLDDLGYAYSSLACNSGRGGFWLYDERFRQLFYININLETVFKSRDLTSITGNHNPSGITEKGQQLYMNIPDSGIFVFDQYANYINNYPVKQASHIGLDQEHIIYYRKGDDLCVYNTRFLEKKMIPLPEKKDLKNIEVIGNKLYLFSASGYDVYIKK